MGAPTEQILWTNEDVTLVANLVRRQKDQVVDLKQVFGVPPNPQYFLDGLHPSLAGQRLIARTLVEQLS